MKSSLHHSGITYTIYAIPFKKMFQTRAPMAPEPYTVIWKLHLHLGGQKETVPRCPWISFSPILQQAYSLQYKTRQLLFNLVLKILTKTVKILRYIKGRTSRRGLLCSNDMTTQKAQSINWQKLKESSAELPERHQYIKINSIPLHHQK